MNLGWQWIVTEAAMLREYGPPVTEKAPECDRGPFY